MCDASGSVNVFQKGKSASATSTSSSSSSSQRWHRLYGWKAYYNESLVNHVDEVRTTDKYRYMSAEDRQKIDDELFAH